METESTGWHKQGQLVVSTLKTMLGQSLVGIYVHGSAALGGWTSCSDLDLLVTTDATDENWESIGTSLLADLFPDPPIELSFVSVSAAATARPPWPFLGHIDQKGDRSVTDDGQGDPDLLLHYLVTRHHGITLIGPASESAFGAVPRTMVLSYLKAELAWALENADQKYAVLNACRAMAYYYDGRVLSKISGGLWALTQAYEQTLIKHALDAQWNGYSLGRPTQTARTFVAGSITRIEAGLAAAKEQK